MKINDKRRFPGQVKESHRVGDGVCHCYSGALRPETVTKTGECSKWHIFKTRREVAKSGPRLPPKAPTRMMVIGNIVNRGERIMTERKDDQVKRGLFSAAIGRQGNLRKVIPSEAALTAGAPVGQDWMTKVNGGLRGYPRTAKKSWANMIRYLSRRKVCRNESMMKSSTLM